MQGRGTRFTAQVQAGDSVQMADPSRESGKATLVVEEVRADELLILKKENKAAAKADGVTDAAAAAAAPSASSAAGEGAEANANGDDDDGRPLVGGVGEWTPFQVLPRLDQAKMFAAVRCCRRTRAPSSTPCPPPR